MPVPLVSVVIPSANRWSFITRSVASALAQQGVDVEVIVATDGERNREAPADPVLRDPRVRILQHPERRGVCKARNVGIEAATGEWIAFLDDDDLWSPHKLRRQLDAAEAAGAGFAYASGAVLTEDLQVMRLEDAPSPDTLLEHSLRMNPLPAGASNLVARADLVRAVGGFDERLQHFGDWDIELNLVYAATGAACAEPLIGYVFHEDAMHVRLIHGVEAEYEIFRDKHAALGRTVNSLVSDRWIASGYRMAGDRRSAMRAYLRTARRNRSAGDVVRAAGTLFGEQAMRVGRGRRPRPAAIELDWLAPMQRERQRAGTAASFAATALLGI